MSITNITLLQEILPNEMFISNNSQVESLIYYDNLEIQIFLSKLEIDQAYVVTFEYVMSLLMYDSDGPYINLGKPILITKNSNAKIISDYIKERINLIIDTFYLDDSILNHNNNPDGPVVLMNYCKINLF